MLIIDLKILAYASSYAKLSEKQAEKISLSGLGLITTWSPQQFILNHPVLYLLFLTQCLEELNKICIGNWMVCYALRFQWHHWISWERCTPVSIFFLRYTTLFDFFKPFLFRKNLLALWFRPANSRRTSHRNSQSSFWTLPSKDRAGSQALAQERTCGSWDTRSDGYRGKTYCRFMP